MPSNSYQFVDDWRVLGVQKDVYDLVTDLKSLPIWWPAVFRDALEIQPGDEKGIDKVTRFETQGWVPWPLHWHACTIEADPPRHYRVEVWGEVTGELAWTLHQDGEWVNVHIEWSVSPTKDSERKIAPLIRPVVASNFHWGLRKGEESLRLEMARRQAATPAERAALGEPPPRTHWPKVPVLGGVGLLGMLILLKRRRGR